MSSYKEFPEVTEETIINDIVHEVAHLLEDKAYFEIYFPKGFLSYKKNTNNDSSLVKKFFTILNQN